MTEAFSGKMTQLGISIKSAEKKLSETECLKQSHRDYLYIH